MAITVAPCRRVSSLARMSSKSERRAAREAVAEYHEARLAELVEHVGDAVDRFRAGELDAFETDQVIFQYSRAAKELWKFCEPSGVEITAGLIADGAPVDWWERGAPRRR
jgi:predicted transcriptional regulator